MAAGFVGLGLQIASYIERGADTQLTCAEELPHNNIFRGNKITNKSAKADLQFSSLNSRLVPKGDSHGSNLNRFCRGNSLRYNVC